MNRDGLILLDKTIVSKPIAHLLPAKIEKVIIEEKETAEEVREEVSTEDNVEMIDSIVHVDVSTEKEEEIDLSETTIVAGNS